MSIIIDLTASQELIKLVRESFFDFPFSKVGYIPTKEEISNYIYRKYGLLITLCIDKDLFYVRMFKKNKHGYKNIGEIGYNKDQYEMIDEALVNLIEYIKETYG